MLSRPINCNSCPLGNLSRGFHQPSLGTNGILLLGESLGAEELPTGLAFQGKAGQVLTRLIERTKDPLTGAPLSRNDFSISNTIWCQPPGNELTGQPYEHEAIHHCAPNLDSFIRETKPKVIVALGNQPLRRLTGLWGIDYWRGSLLESPYGWVVPTFHPSYIMRGNWRFAQVFIRDVLRALDISRGGGHSTTTDYVLYPSPNDFSRFVSEWRDSGKPTLAFDIETNYSGGEGEDALEEIHLEETDSYQINRISFAFKEGHAITMPWQMPLSAMAIELLGEAPDLTVFNESFDVPRLMANGVKFTGRIADAMLSWHMYKPSLPYNLQLASSMIVPGYRAWKKTSGEDPERYSCIDSDYLLRVHNHVKAALTAEGRWTTFERHFIDVGKILRKMSAYGVRVDPIKRKAAKAEFDAEMLTVAAACQPHITFDLLPKKIFKISKERLEKKFGSLEPPLWTTISESLTESELQKLNLKREKQLQKELKQREKQLLKDAKAAERLKLKEARSLKSKRSKSAVAASQDTDGSS